MYTNITEKLTMESRNHATNINPPTHLVIRHLRKIHADFWKDNGQLQNYLNFALCEIDPLLSQKRLAAEVVLTTKESDETTTLVLRPAPRWRDFSAGQFIAVELEIDGIRHRRNYSLSCSPKHYHETGLISITVKTVKDGKASKHVNQALGVGDIIHISQATGKFTWHKSPKQSAGSLFIAGGSGITPIKSMIDQLTYDNSSNASSGVNEPITLIHYAKNTTDIIFKTHFEQLTKRFAHFTYVCHFSDQEGAVCAKQLELDCPDHQRRTWYLCGPDGFMDTVSQIANSLSVSKEQIFTESFGSSRHPNGQTKAGSPGKITFNLINKKVQSDGQKSLLELAELAGLQPEYGCRNGVCHQCKCQRPEGRLFNRMTGKEIPEDQHTIQACIAVPTGDLTLNPW